MERELRKIRLEDTEQQDIATYTVYALCDNCDWKGDVAIPKGTPIKKGEELGALVVCSNCGCFTLKRIDKVPQINDWSEEMRRIMRERPTPQPMPEVYPIVPTILPSDNTWHPPYTYPRYTWQDVVTTSTTGPSLDVDRNGDFYPRNTPTPNHNGAVTADFDTMMSSAVTNLASAGLISTNEVARQFGLSLATTNKPSAQ